MAVLVVGTTLAVPASAHEKRFKTRVTISEPSPFNFEGQVISKKRACVRFRLVQMWQDYPGDADEKRGDPFPTDREGHWNYGFFGKDYYVTVKRIVKTPGRHRHVCKGDRSPTV